MVKLGNIYQVDIQSLADNGYGLAYIQREPIYVKQALPKERVSVKIVKRLKHGYVGEIVKWLVRDAHRTDHLCDIYHSCGSCHLLHCDYQHQLNLKQAMVEQWVKESALSLSVRPIIGMSHPYHYRNKVIVSFQRDKNGKLQKGFYEEFSHRIIPYQSCLLHDEGMDDIINSIALLAKQQRMEPYDENRHKGFLRHVLLRKGRISKELMVVLVTASAQFPGRKNFVSALLKKHPEITTIVQNVNARKTSVVLGEEERVLYGKGKIEDILLGNRYQISSKSFYQINHEQCEVLYRKAIELLDLSGNEKALDAYCGIGTIGLSMAKYVKQIVGVEANQQAVRDAIANAAVNHIVNARFICDDATHFMEQAAAKKQHFDVVIMDPPRSGSSEQFMKACAKMKPRQIVYISCDPRTQLRDLEFFKRYGYEGKELHLVDLFPNTNHVETVVMLSRKKPDSVINVKRGNWRG